MTKAHANLVDILSQHSAQHRYIARVVRSCFTLDADDLRRLRCRKQMFFAFEVFRCVETPEVVLH